MASAVRPGAQGAGSLCLRQGRSPIRSRRGATSPPPQTPPNLLCMNKLTLSLSLASAGLVACSTALFAVDGKPATGGFNESETKFAKTAAEGGMAEVKLGELAKEKASSPEVKSFGEKMVADHTKANEDLKGVAEKKGVTLPTELMGSEKATYEKMSKMSGPAFDKAYAADMVKDHKKDVAEFEAQSKSAKDSELKGFVDKTLPVLKEHLHMAEMMAKETASKK